MDPFTIASLGVGLIGSIGKMFGRGKANRRLRELEESDPIYSANPLAAERLALSKNLLNARAPGAQSVERNIYANQGNQIGDISRNATDSSQALALGASTVGQSNQAFNQLGEQETQDYQRRYGNVVNAEEGVINEGNKVFQDQVRRFGDKAQIRGGINENQQSNWGDVSNLGFGLSNFGMAGGFKNMFGKKGAGNKLDFSWFKPQQPRDVPLEYQ
jgi:hypothetical protein